MEEEIIRLLTSIDKKLLIIIVLILMMYVGYIILKAITNK